MERIERMIEETKSSSVAFMTFVRIAAKDRGAAFCFFEGEDEKYYGVRIGLHLRGRPWHSISCGGKSSVLNLHDEIASRKFYKDIDVAFFVDRDFDAPLVRDVNSKIYETPCYSVENFYCDTYAIKQILSAEFGIPEQAGTNQFFNFVFERILKIQEAFHRAIISVNYFIKAHRQKEKSESHARLNLQNVSLDQLVKISLDSVESIVSLEDLNSVFPKSFSIGELGIDELPPFDNNRLHYELRGKYELEFIRCVLSKLREACSRKDHEFYRTGYAIKLNLTKANVISELSQYATTTPCLHAFLDRLARQPEVVHFDARATAVA